MSHNLATIQGKTAFVLNGTRKDAWHELGQRVDHAMTAKETAEQSGLTYKGVKVQNYATGPNGVLVPVDSYSVFRDTDSQLLASKVGKGYTLVQIEDAFAFVDSLIESEDGAHYDSAGALGVGEKVFMSVRIPQTDSEIVTGDSIENYLIFTTSFDGSGASEAFISAVRPVCQNTLRMALSSQSGIVRIKHTKNQTGRFEMAKKMMRGVKQDANSLRDKLRMLASRKMTKDSLLTIMDRLFPVPENQKISTRRDNILADVLSLYESNDNNAIPEIRGTAYNLLNAVTEYTDHYRIARVTEGRAGYTQDRARAENAVNGTGDRLKNTALDVILEMTDGSQVIRPMTVNNPIPESGSLLDAVIDNHS